MSNPGEVYQKLKKKKRPSFWNIEINERHFFRHPFCPALVCAVDANFSFLYFLQRVMN